MPTIYCPFCNHPYNIESNIIGKNVQCIVCKEPFIALLPETNEQSDTKQLDIRQTPSANQQQQAYQQQQATQQQPTYQQQQPVYQQQQIPPGYVLVPLDYLQNGMRQAQSHSSQNIWDEEDTPAQKAKSRAVFILFGLFFGYLGIHDFYAGHTARGWTHLCITPISTYLLWTSNGILVIWGICLLIVNDAWGFLESIMIQEDANGVPME